MEPVEITKPRTWISYQSGMCETCWAGCCHGMPVEVSVPDLIRLGVLSEDEASTSLKKASKRLQKQGVVSSFRSRTMIFVLQQKSNGDCRYLNDKRQCTVYENRPEICRQFPKIGPRPGHCPYQKK